MIALRESVCLQKNKKVEVFHRRKTLFFFYLNQIKKVTEIMRNIQMNIFTKMTLDSFGLMLVTDKTIKAIHH